MKQALISIVCAIMLLCTMNVNAASVNKVVGLNSDATGSPSAIPLSGSFVCDGSGVVLNCPQYFHPDWSDTSQRRIFGITNRLNPPIYVVSINSGLTFAPITTQPFVAAVLNLGAKMAVASDGSLLVASGQGASTCLIRRSTDQGTSWSTVFTDAVQVCSIGFGSPTPPEMYCAETGGYCAVINPFNAATITVIYSTDNGANWTIGTAYAHFSSDQRTWGPILTTDASDGLIVRGVNASGAGNAFGIKSGNDFIATPLFAAPVNLNCRPLFMGLVSRAVCAPNAGGNSYRLVTGGALGIAPVVSKTFTVPDTSGVLEPQVLGYNATTGYLIQVSVATTTRLNVFVTIDTWTAVVLAGQLTPITAPVAGCCKGNIIKWGSKIYFSSGAGGSQAFLGLIQF